MDTDYSNVTIEDMKLMVLKPNCPFLKKMIDKACQIPKKDIIYSEDTIDKEEYKEKLKVYVNMAFIELQRDKPKGIRSIENYLYELILEINNSNMNVEQKKRIYNGNVKIN